MRGMRTRTLVVCSRKELGERVIPYEGKRDWKPVKRQKANLQSERESHVVFFFSYCCQQGDGFHPHENQEFSQTSSRSKLCPMR